MAEHQQSQPPRPSSRVTMTRAMVVAVIVFVVALVTGIVIATTSMRPSGTQTVVPTTPVSSPNASADRTRSPGPTPTNGASEQTEPTTKPTTRAADWQPRLKTGPWPTAHVQGVAVDPKGFIYYSFTTLLVKTDLTGKLIGTVGGFTGHLGDLAFNPADGKVYGSLEYKDEKAFYIAIFDVDQIDRTDIQAQNSSILSTVYLPEVVDDFTADLDGDGHFAGDTADTRDHRYGTSGIDGIAFGPKFGSTQGRQYLTIAYGIYQNSARSDNDHQVLLQYDSRRWADIARPLAEGRAHHKGPDKKPGKYFVFTGNTRYGVQSLEYDPWLARWFLGVYEGNKPRFPNYSLFAIDAADKPRVERLRGLSGEEGALLPLADDGLKDSRTGIRGWQVSVPYGLVALGDGLYYLVDSTSRNGESSAELQLASWTGDPDGPFEPVKR